MPTRRWWVPRLRLAAELCHMPDPRRMIGYGIWMRIVWHEGEEIEYLLCEMAPPSTVEYYSVEQQERHYDIRRQRQQRYDNKIAARSSGSYGGKSSHKIQDVLDVERKDDLCYVMNDTRGKRYVEDAKRQHYVAHVQKHRKKLDNLLMKECWPHQ